MEPLPKPTLPLEGLGNHHAACPSHGPFVSRGVRVRHTEIWSHCPLCAEDKRIADAEMLAVQAAERESRARAVALGAVGIPPRFVGRTLDTYNVESAAQRHALTAARQYAEDFPDNAKRGGGLIFAGAPGTGKSHLAAAILQAVVTPQTSGQYMTCLDLIRAVRDTWRRTSERSEVQVLRELSSVELLVIDEVGAQYGTDGEQQILFDVLDRRYRDVRATVLLTNQDSAGFKSFVGDRTYDRLLETCRWVPFDWQSYRPTARREAA